MHLRIAVVALALFCLAGSHASAGYIQLVGHDPVSGLNLDVFVNLVNVLGVGPPIVPPDPLMSGPPIHPAFTTAVDNDARFDFGMRGQNGETFLIDPLPETTSSDSEHMFHHFLVSGTTHHFDLFLDAAWQSPNGDNHSPLSAVANQGPPIFPAGSLSVNYHVKDGDPPFTVGIMLINPDGPNGLNGPPVIFSLAPASNGTVHEPGSLAMVLGGLIALGAAGATRRKRRASGSKAP